MNYIPIVIKLIKKIITFTCALHLIYKLPIIADLIFLASEKDRILIKKFKFIMKEGYNTPYQYYKENIMHLYHWDKSCRATDGGSIAAGVTHVPICELSGCKELWNDSDSCDSICGSNFQPSIKRFITKEYRGFLYEKSLYSYTLSLFKFK